MRVACFSFYFAMWTFLLFSGLAYCEDSAVALNGTEWERSPVLQETEV